MMDYTQMIDKSIGKELKDRVVHHKARFIQLFKARYMEMLPSLIKYNQEHTVSVDFMKVEVALRSGYDVVIGQTNDQKIKVIGYAQSTLTSGNPADLWSTRRLRHGDIKFIIPDYMKLLFYREISYDDECRTGNFVVLRNKILNYVTDYDILEHYTDELAEIVLSRYSISMQVKINTLFLGEPNDQSIQNLISDIYNGSPFIEGSKLFDPEEQIYHMKNESIASNFQELKREYQNKISELNNMIGMNSLAVEKASGVSDEEAKSNRAYTTSNANVYLDARNDGLKKLNKRFDLHLQAVYNDEVLSEFAEIAKVEEVKEGGSTNGNDNNDTL